jgi:predicted amidophosphoribosyltransferase
VAGVDLDRLLLEAPGFGKCPSCKFLQAGSAALCFRCARRTMEPLAADADRCKVCDQEYPAGTTECKNPVCGMSERWFGWNFAIAVRSGVLQSVINAYKYSPATSSKRGWAAIFGRILVGFLEANAETFGTIDLIVASPTYTGPGARRDWDHIRDILVAAHREQVEPRHWPFDLDGTPAIVKLQDTESMTGKSYRERRVLAESEIRDALQVPDPARTRGRRIVVVDDVFTDGLTLREVARALRQQGRAASVYGITLARQPFGR